ncbi:MAG TPA: biosynthetic peptidoglycan transglycosylase [Frankiaceae bacterium]|nr:biosynthetic peptidoglycan transglycosylase [Frankiaceae bacterium]
MHDTLAEQPTHPGLPVVVAPGPGRGRRVRLWFRRHRWVKRTLVGLLSLLLISVLAFVTVWNLTPGVSDAQARTAAIVASHGAISDKGVPPQRVSQALIATEDSRFYSHHGLDPQSIARGVYTFVTQGTLQGATLDAQLAKLLYSGEHSGVWYTTQEAMLALKLDDSYTKRQILAMYLDAAYFGHGAWGVEKASEVYFGLPADRLSWGQASLLAGLVNAPTAYDPTAHLTLARSRQHHVLDRLVATHVLTRTQADAVFAEDLHPAVPFTG